MDSINIENLIIFANHGLYKEEKNLGQKFLLDIKLNLDSQAAAISEDLEKSVHYGLLIKDVEKKFKEKSIDLIETLAEEIAHFILDKYKLVESVEIRVKKPWAPVLSALDNIWVEIKRSRNRAFIGLGSNMGDSKDLLKKAIKKLDNKYTRVIRESKIYKTKAWGFEEQDDFFNMVVEVETTLLPKNLLLQTQKIEDELGRVRNKHWGPRTIDLDILFYGDKILYEDDFKIPHPYIEERSFVLDPLNEIAPFFIHPVNKKQIRYLKKELDSKDKNILL